MTIPGRSATVRLMIVDDHPLVRDGLRTRLEAVPHLLVVGEAATGRAALERLPDLLPRILIVDIGMKDMDGIELTRRVCRDFPSVSVVVLSMHGGDEYVLNAARAGARGYVLKEASVYEVIAAIDAVVAGGTFYSAGISKALALERRGPTTLTARERQILVMLAHGHTNKAVAGTLGISMRTVETHRLRMRRKLGIDTPVGLLKYALDRGWTTLG